MSFSNEFLSKWEHLINGVDVTDVPLECIHKIKLRLVDRRSRTINLRRLREQGLDYDEIEVLVERVLSELGETVRDAHFIVDVSAVAEIAQGETNKLLSGL